MQNGNVFSAWPLEVDTLAAGRVAPAIVFRRLSEEDYRALATLWVIAGVYASATLTGKNPTGGALSSVFAFLGRLLICIPLGPVAVLFAMAERPKKLCRHCRLRIAKDAGVCPYCRREQWP